MVLFPPSCNRKISFQQASGQETAGFPLEKIQFEKDFRARLRIRVVIADDHPVMRNGLSEIVSKQDDMEIIGQAADGGQAVSITLQVKPDVVLMDVIMPVLDGIEATQKIKAERPETCIIGLTIDEDPSVQDEMKRAGARQCLTKSCPTEMLLSAIRNCINA